MLNRWAITWLFPVALSGCAEYHYPSKVPTQLEELRSQITPRQTSREEVQERLGPAFISDNQVEVYRPLRGYDLMLGGPIVPVAWDTEEVIIYALVIYGENDLVEDIDWSVYQQDRQSIGGNRKDITDWFRSARLLASEFRFAAFNAKEILGSTRKELLLAPPSLTQSTLEAPPPAGMCAVFIFLEEVEDGRGLDRKLYLDDDYIAEMPLVPSAYWYWAAKGYWDPYYLNIFVKILVPEGQHELRITTSLKPSDFHRKFECNPGQRVYVQPHLKLVKSEPWGLWGKRLRYEGEISISHRPVTEYDGWKRLLFYDRTWFGDD
jgi:hypothetical protein